MTPPTRRPPVEPGRLLDLIDAFRGLRIAVYGDLLVDEFIYGEISRVSREAPVLILNYNSTEIVPGAPAMPPTTSPHSEEHPSPWVLRDVMIPGDVCCGR